MFLRGSISQDKNKLVTFFFFRKHMTGSGIAQYWFLFLRTCTWHTDFSSRMMHGCGLANMTGSLRSSHCRMCLHYRLPGSLANLLTSSPARYSTEEQFAVIDTVTTLSPLLSPRPLRSSPPRPPATLSKSYQWILKPWVGFINGLSCLWHHN